jgi:predicted RNase H-like HicB family nuclease
MLSRWSSKTGKEYELFMTFTVEIEREDDARWIADLVELPGVLAHGDTKQAALSRVQALALRVIAERLEYGEKTPCPKSW